MRVVVALGGNALLRRGQPLTADNQRHNVRLAAQALAPLAAEHELVVSHGNGPQVGLLALQGAAYKPDEIYPLDVLDAETEGMIGYLIEQELVNILPVDRRCATLLTQVEVDVDDPAFKNSSKPVGPVYPQAEAEKLARDRNWSIAQDGEGFRRIVPSPRPRRIIELPVIELLVGQDVIVICGGGGGIPVVRRDDGALIGVEAVIDKDFASALLAKELAAGALLMLTDVDAVYRGWGSSEQNGIRCIAPGELRGFSFAAGSMGPKVTAACEFVEATGGIAGIGRLQDARDILDGRAGTTVRIDCKHPVWWDGNG
jgi:carbamate kinase